MISSAGEAKNICLQVIHNKSLKKFQLLRSILRSGARGIAHSLAIIKGLRFPPKWDWYPKLEFLFRMYEPGTTLLCKRLIMPGMHVVDVGANIGYYALLFSDLVGKNGRVYAFEPHLQIFELLKNNVRRRENVDIYQKVVSNINSEVDFHFSKRTRSHSLYVHDESLHIGSARVESVTLDSFLRDKQCNFIKIDVEGAEPLVVKGMSNLLTTAQKLTIVIEFNPSALLSGRHNPDEFLSMLIRDFLFHIYLIDEKKGNLIEIKDMTFVKDIPEWHAVNLLCCKGVSL